MKCEHASRKISIFSCWWEFVSLSSRHHSEQLLAGWLTPCSLVFLFQLLRNYRQQNELETQPHMIKKQNPEWNQGHEFYWEGSENGKASRS